MKEKRVVYFKDRKTKKEKEGVFCGYFNDPDREIIALVEDEYGYVHQLYTQEIRFRTPLIK